MKKCKAKKIFPGFVENNVFINADVLFPFGPSPYVHNLMYSLKSLSLNQAISQHYADIRSFKFHINKLKNQLSDILPSEQLFRHILLVFNSNNTSVKETVKHRLQEKLRNLERRSWPQYNTESSDEAENADQIPFPPGEPGPLPPLPTIGRRENQTQRAADVEPIVERAADRVTEIQVELSDAERAALALGPKFALTPRIDEKLLDTVRVEIAACAYRLRWVEHMKSVHSCQPLLQHLKKSGCPFQRPFAKTPPINNLDIEDSLKQLSLYIIKQIKKCKLSFNMTPTEASGLKSLKIKRDEFHFSVSDKGGEFVVMKKQQHQQLTEQHLTTAGVYKFVQPTRKRNGELHPIANPTDTSYNRQLKGVVDQLESGANALWSTICERRNFGVDLTEFFKAHNTQLPTMYVLLKTHKFQVSDINSDDDIMEKCKVRPIVSCCGSPTERLAWICTHILSPILQQIPCHLQNIHQHLEDLAKLTPTELKGWKFCTADVTSLYTNIDIQGCVENVMEMAAEHQDKLTLCGLQLRDVHEMLEYIFGKAYFCFNNRLYLQLMGLFMGCKPSPIGAIIRVYYFERRSIYTDSHYLPVIQRLYRRYVDDAGTLAESKDHATQIFNSIASEDKDGRLAWEIDYSDTNSFLPFLGTEVRIDDQGVVHHKFYRKEQKKQITLHYRSHHPFKTKLEVVKNFYKTAEKSSTPQYLEESKQIVDHLLRCNGYSDPRQYLTLRHKVVSTKIKDVEMVNLKLPYISEQVSAKILRFIKDHSLPITVIFLPGKKLRDLFCSSRPLDKRKCVITNCLICPKLQGDIDCSTTGPVYQITCRHCGQIYVGESSRSLHDRLGEHLRYARSPNSPSYKDEAMAVHYRENHPNTDPELIFHLLKVENKTILRKIYEAMYIYNLKPDINDKEEIKVLERFLVNNDTS